MTETFRLTRRALLGRMALSAAGLLAACAAPSAPQAPTVKPAPAPTSPAAPTMKPAGLRAVKMTLPWFPDGQFTYALLAKELGYWQQLGLDVTIENRQGSGAAIDALGAKQYDFGIADLGNMINGVARGYALTAVGCVQPISGAGLTFLTSTGIRTPKDLEGKRYVTTPGSGEYVIWPAFVAATGIDASKVNVIYAAPNVWDAMVQQGQADVRGSFYAAVAPTYWDKKLDFGQLLFASYGVQASSNSIIAQSDLVKNDPDLCARFVKGLLQGLEYTYLQPDNAAETHLKLTPQYTAASFIRDGIGCNTALGLVDYVRDQGLGYLDSATFDRTVQVISQGLQLTGLPPTRDLYTNQFVEAAAVKLTAADWDKVRAATKRYTDFMEKPA